MKMTEQQIVDLITQSQPMEFAGTITDLVGRYIHHLASISHKLDSDEMAHMIVIATVLYQMGYKEFTEGT